MDWLKGRVVYILFPHQNKRYSVMDWLKGRVVYIFSFQSISSVKSWIG